MSSAKTYFKFLTVKLTGEKELLGTVETFRAPVKSTVWHRDLPMALMSESEWNIRRLMARPGVEISLMICIYIINGKRY